MCLGIEMNRNSKSGHTVQFHETGALGNTNSQ